MRTEMVIVSAGGRTVMTETLPYMPVQLRYATGLTMTATEWLIMTLLMKIRIRQRSVLTVTIMMLQEIRLRITIMTGSVPARTATTIRTPGRRLDAQL